MTFYGESLAIQDATVLTGSLSWSDLYYGVQKYGDGLSATWNVGDSFWVAFISSDWLNTGDVMGALKWGLRAVGTATLELADAHNYDWGYGPSTVDWQALPTVTISESALADVTFDASPSLKDTDLIVAGDDALMLRVTVTSGSLEVDKARLQIEPVGGISTGGRWSDWQDSTPSYASATQSARIQEDYGETSMVSNFTVTEDGALIASQTRLDGEDINPATYTRSALQWSAGTAWQALRDRLPEAVGLLTYGVDYFPQNGRTFNDTDCYVQYESTDPNVLTGWAGTDIILVAAEYDHYHYVYPDVSGTAAFTLKYIYDGPVYASGDSVTAWPGGASFGTGDKTTTTGTTYPFDPGVATHVLILAESASTLPAIYLASDFAHFTPDYLRVAYLQPRYRYWIPGPAEVPNLSGELLGIDVRFYGG